MSFGQIKDQDVPVRLLRNLLRRRRIPNAMLFWGPSGVGKRLTAIQLAKAVNCAEGGDDACDRCLSCRKVESGNHPDVRVIAPLKKSRTIDVDTIESVNELASLRPYESAWRVVLFLDADRMRPPAQNHFLKTLEEPPGNSLFVLVTEYPRVLLPTIRSRCQMVRFGTLKPETVAGLLRRARDLPHELAESIAGLAQGQMSRALDLIDSDKREIALDITRRLAEGDDPVALAEEFAGHLAAQREHIQSGVNAELDSVDPDVMTPTDRDRLKEEHAAFVDALWRRDIMEYLYLLKAWYRDEQVWHVTGDMTYILNRDQQARLASGRPCDFEKKIAAIEKARQYLERFIKEERVFRDLFFVLAD